MKIFISHSSHDKWVARQLSKSLISDGHETFLDEKDIVTGESIDASIQNNLKNSDHLLLLLTPASLKSQWVFIELGGAKALGKHIVPVLFHVASNEIPQAISQLLARDINEIEKYFSELKKLQNATPAQAAAMEAATTSAKGAPKSTKKTLYGFKVGDKVKIVSVEHLTEGDRDQAPKWTPGMDKFSDVVTTIRAFSPAGYIYLDASGDAFKWSPAWITKVL